MLQPSKYMEACESVSIFEKIFTADKKLLLSLPLLSWIILGIYCHPDDVVNETYIGTIFGDFFSINCMEDANKAHSSTKTF